MLRFSLAVCALLAACATKGSGLDSESHFACNSDADCAPHQGLSVCVEHVCARPDASASASGGSSATGGRGAMNTGGVNASGAMNTGGVNMSGGAGGAAGHGNASSGGRSPSLPPDATSPEPSDAGVCLKCTKDLPDLQSLDCYCRSHSCDADLATALANPKWESVEEGCGLIVVYFDFGIGGLSGQKEVFDIHGQLLGAESWNDEISQQCLSPNDNQYGEAAGGNYLPPEAACKPTPTCTLTAAGDGGRPRCDVDALLNEGRVDAGPPCADGEMGAYVCPSCVSGCVRRELKCGKICTTTDDCTAAHVTGTCVDSICQEFCPF